MWIALRESRDAGGWRRFVIQWELFLENAPKWIRPKHNSLLEAIQPSFQEIIRLYKFTFSEWVCW